MQDIQQTAEDSAAIHNIPLISSHRLACLHADFAAGLHLIKS